MATKTQLESLNNDLLASNQPIPAVQHRQFNQEIINELYNAQSRGNVLKDVQTSVSATSDDFILVLKTNGQAYRIKKGVLISPDHFKGKYLSEAALNAAYPVAVDGDYAIVDEGMGDDAIQYIWDAEDGWVSAGAIGGGDVFPSDVTITLSGGKTLGKYINGSIAPWTGLTAVQALIDAAIEYLYPFFASFGISGQVQTVEVGTTISGSKTFVWSINTGSGTVTTIDVVDVTGATNLLTNTPNDGTQSVSVGSYQLNSNGANRVYKGVAHDTGSNPSNVDSANFTITARFMDFWGANSGTPANSAAVRALPSSAFRNGGSVRTLSTGTTQVDFIVATLGTITQVIDQTALNANITSDYVSLGTISVNDAGGTARTYNLYKMTIGAPYVVSHDHLITIA